MSWSFKPAYLLSVSRVDPATQQITDTFSCRSLVSLQASLSTGANVGQCSVTLSDHDGLIQRDPKTAPHSMDLLQLRLTNRHGQQGVAWTGIIDEAHRVVDPTQGITVNVTATTPQKLWEITRQLPADVIGLQLSSVSGIKGSEVLKYSAGKVAYPGPLAALPRAVGLSYVPALKIDAGADSGIANLAGVDMGSAENNPDQQSWSAVLQSLQADSGLEWFFDELGNGIWRRPGFLAATARPRRILPEDILHLDLAESDQSVVTRVEVRWGQMPSTQTAVAWQAPVAMIQHLHARTLILYAPWVFGPNAASTLARQLLQMYAANQLVGSVTIPADPLYQVGSIIEVPTLRGNETGYYYVGAVEYHLDWGNSWAMTLGLAYGRAPGAQYSYLGSSSVPLLSAGQAGQQLPQGTFHNVTVDPNNPHTLTTSFNLVQRASLSISAAVADPNIFPPNTIITAIKDAQGHVVGNSPNGEYLVNGDGVPNSGPVLYIAFTGGVTTGYVTWRDAVAGSDPTKGSPSGDPPTPAPSGGGTDTTGGKDLPTPNAFQVYPVAGNSTATLGQPFGPTDFTGEPPFEGFAHFHFGIDIIHAPPGASSIDGAQIHAVTTSVVTGIGHDLTVDGIHYGGDNGGFGYNIVTRAGDISVHYAHCREGSATVVVGDRLSPSTNVALVGLTGNTTGPHLHLGVFDHVQGAFVDPVPFFQHSGL